ncbi:MAG TPA: lasso peptide biosynthesis B2 protein [Thermoanaerobaculia bacterium]|jgi:hypothetical protein|nr:lasso peptide biosynthesis B2 protein [Thermoanaerobaculia bacterium]
MTLLIEAAIAVAAARLLPVRIVLDAHVPRSPRDRSAEAIAAAIRRIPFTNCLTRTLAATLLLRRYRHQASSKFAFHRGGAHAWVELDGKAILDQPAPIGWEPFTLLPR